MNDDADLVRDVLAGRVGAFERLVVRHQRLVWHLIVRMVRQPDDADELSQEVFLLVHRKLEQFRSESSLSTWIGQIAWSVATRFLQKKRLPISEAMDDDGDSLLDRVSDDFDLAEAFSDGELMGHVGRLIDALPAAQRTVLSLFHLEDVPLEEIAAMTGMPVGTVKSHLFRARAKLRAGVEQLAGVAA